MVDRDGYVICTAAEAADQLGRARPPPAAASLGRRRDAASGRGEAPRRPRRRDGTSADAAAAGDAGSVVERLVAGPEQAALPLPRIAVSGRVRRGSSVTDKAAVEMLAVIAALPRSLQRRLAAVQDDDGQLTLRFAGGPVTTWGDSERTLAKTVALRTVLKKYEDAGKTCTQLDVSIPDRTLAKPVLQ